MAGTRIFQGTPTGRHLRVLRTTDSSTGPSSCHPGRGRVVSPLRRVRTGSNPEQVGSVVTHKRGWGTRTDRETGSGLRKRDETEGVRGWGPYIGRDPTNNVRKTPDPDLHPWQVTVETEDGRQSGALSGHCHTRCTGTSSGHTVGTPAPSAPSSGTQRLRQKREYFGRDWWVRSVGVTRERSLGKGVVVK